jgi:hypothetical protein
VSVFLTDEVELRSGWRFAAYVMAYVAVYLATGAVTAEVMSAPVDFGGVQGLALGVMTFVPPAVLAFLFVLRFVDRRPARAFGITTHERWGRDLVMGVLVAVVMTGVFAIGAVLLGAWTPDPTSSGAQSTILITIGLLAIAAATEEFVYRGYPFQVLIIAVGPLGAVAIMSTLFGLGHYLNPNATWLGTLNVCLAGALLCLAYLRTRSLWLPYGIHIGWNLLTGVLLGLPVSGVRLASIWRVDTGGAEWLTGGSFGPEGGILATIAIIAAAVVVGTTHQVEISPTLRVALQGDARPGQARKF